LIHLNQYWFTEKLPTSLKTLLTSNSEQTWQKFNQLFQHQFTTFNGHLLLFDQGSHNALGLADYDRYLWALLWQGSGLVFAISYLSTSFYSWRTSRQALN
ncbi:MAG: hypothetical protein L0H66_04125, partial [Loigolactobacillus coryniformis]|nr:hypothetical protein [Loigolactobacillus coryniformis]